MCNSESSFPFNPLFGLDIENLTAIINYEKQYISSPRILPYQIQQQPVKTKRRFWAKFHLFSAHFPPMVSHIFLPTCIRNSPISAYFLPIFHIFSTYFPPKMVPHPCYKLKHGTHLPIFCPHVYGFCLCCAHFLPIFCLTFRPFSPVLSCRECFPLSHTSLLLILIDSSGQALFCVQQIGVQCALYQGYQLGAWN